MKHLIVIFGILIFTLGCESLAVEPTETGSIEGKVSIGPLCGNIPIASNNSNPCGWTDEQINGFYSKYKVAVSGVVNGKTISNEFVLNKTGKFSFEVPVGSYKVEVITPEGSQSSTLSGNLDSRIKSVSVMKNQITVVDLIVDTGIK
jgi:hypothetical protein